MIAIIIKETIITKKITYGIIYWMKAIVLSN